MDKEIVQLLGQQMLDAVKGYVARMMGPLAPRIEALEKRIAELERGQKGLISYRGVWREGDDYREHDVTTHSGCLWFCQTPTTERPGSSNDWRLMQKNHR